MDLPDLPEGWKLKSLLDTGEGASPWKVFAYSPTEWVQAAGSSPRFAMFDAISRIEDGATYRTLSGMTLKSSLVSLNEVLQALKIEPAKSTLERRF